MRIIENVINNMKIRSKLIISYLLIVIVTVVIIGGYLTSRMNNIVVQKEISEGRYNNKTIKRRMEEALKLAIITSDLIYQDVNIHALVTENYNNYGDVVTAYSSFNVLNDYLVYYNDFNSIKLYVDNETLLNGSNIIKVDDEIRESEWYKNAIDGK